MIRLDEPMSAHTTFGVGGPADVFVTPSSVDELVAAVGACRRLHVPHFVLGKGSDLLVSDEGYRGVIIATTELRGVEVHGQQLICEAGATLSSVAKKALGASLTGFEFASGIPGSIGGACFMNAGAYGGSMSDVLVSVDVLTPEGDLRTIAADELELGYRTSRIRTDDLVVLRATLQLEQGEADAIRARMVELKRQRNEKQPLEYGSAGSTFKRPEGYFAGKLIMDAGLKGYTVGDACVSTKHSGFVVNLGHATAADVCAVISHVQDEVMRQFGVALEPEVRFLGW